MLHNINSSGLVALVCVYVCARVVAVSMAGFQKLFILVFLFSPLPTPPCITALRLLRSLFLGFLIDMQQPTSLNGVFYALWFSALASPVMFPFLGWCILPLSSSTIEISLFIYLHMAVKAHNKAWITCAMHKCWSSHELLPYFLA